MTVLRVTSIQRYIGLDADTKPTSCNVGSTFWATDSKILYITPDGGTTWVVKSTADVPQADVDSFILADADDYDIADANADNERWNAEYLSGAEGGSADIDTTTADKLMVKVDPDATPTAARYAVSHNIAFFADYLTVTSDVSATWGATDSATAKAVGLLISKGAAYDADNIVAIERQKGTGVDRIQARATFAAVGQTSVNAAVTDDAVALKIERWNNTWECYYSLSQYPGEVWVHLASFEDTADAMSEQTTFYNEASTPGSADAESAQGDFGHFRYYLGAGGGGQYIAGPFDSTFIAANADGNVFERQEWAQRAMGAEYDGSPDLYDVTVTGLNSASTTNNFDGSILEVVKAGLEQTTGGAYDPDTDSNEALSEELAKVPKSDAAVSWNATALQAIQDEAEDALEGENLDHLQALTTVAADMTAEVVDGSVVSRMLSKTSDTSTYDPVTDAQEMLSDKLGAFSGDGGAAQDDSVKASLDLAHTDLDTIITATDTVEAEIAKIPKSDAAVTWNATALASIQTEANDALVAQNLDHVAAVTTVAADMTAEVVDGSVVSRMLSKTSDTSTYDPTTDAQEMLSDKLGAFTGDGGAAQDDSAKASLDLAHTDLDTIITATDTVEAELAKVPKSDAAVTWNATALASVNAEVDTALNTIVPAAPTAGSLNDTLSKASGGNTFDKTTDSLEALRDRIDAVETADQADLDAILADTGTDGVVLAANAVDAAKIAAEGAVKLTMGVRVTRATADVITGGTVGLFTVSGGEVLITGIYGVVTIDIGIGVTNFRFISTPTVGSQNNLCADVDIGSLAAGGKVGIKGDDSGTAGIKSTGGMLPGMERQGVVVPAGTISCITDADRTGSIRFVLFYLPIDSGATVSGA